MHARPPLSLPDVLLLYRHDQGLTRQQVARETGICPHCYEKLEAGLGCLSRQALETLYVRLPIIAALMTDLTIPMPAAGQLAVSRLQTLIGALERLPADDRAVELTRIRLQLAWQEPASRTAAVTGDEVANGAASPDGQAA